MKKRISSRSSLRRLPVVSGLLLAGAGRLSGRGAAGGVRLAQAHHLGLRMLSTQPPAQRSNSEPGDGAARGGGGFVTRVDVETMLRDAFLRVGSDSRRSKQGHREFDPNNEVPVVDRLELKVEALQGDIRKIKEDVESVRASVQGLQKDTKNEIQASFSAFEKRQDDRFNVFQRLQDDGFTAFEKRQGDRFTAFEKRQDDMRSEFVRAIDSMEKRRERDHKESREDMAGVRRSLYGLSSTVLVAAVGFFGYQARLFSGEVKLAPPLVSSASPKPGN